MATTYSPEFEKATYSKVTRRLIPFLFLCYILAYLDRVNVGFAKLQMQADLSFSDTVYGLGAGIFFLGYFLFEVPSNVLLQKIGAKIWIARIMIMWGVISAGMMFTNSEMTFYVLRFLLGVTEAGFFPGIILYLTYWYTRTHRAKAVAAFMTAIAFAGIIGGPISGWIMQTMGGVGGLANWQWLYLLEGIPSVVVGIWVLFYLDNGPTRAKWLTQEEKDFIKHRLDEEEELKAQEGHGHHSFADAFRSYKVWLLSFVYFGIVMGVYGVSFWLPQIIKETLTKDVFYVGLLSTIPWGAAVVAMVINGRHSDKTGERTWHVAGPAIIGAIAFAASGLPGISGVLGIIALTVATAGAMAAVSCFWTLPTGILSGTAAAAGIAWINSVGNLAGYASPFIVGKIRDATHSMTLALLVLAASLLGAGLLTFYINTLKPKQKPAAEGA